MLDKILIVVGTRPEIIKMAPVYSELCKSSSFEVVTCLTGQHRDLPRPFLDLFKWEPQYTLETMIPGQSLNHLGAKIMAGVEEVIRDARPAFVLVHGDTTTTLMAAIASFHAHVPVGHIEAGLRTHDIRSPWPEEMNRKITDQISSCFFAPSESARQNLLSEGISDSQIFVSGNTIVDSVIETYERLMRDKELYSKVQSQFKFLQTGKKTVLATNHRRENLGKPIENIFHALMDIARDPNVQIVCPIHPNPEVRRAAGRIFKDSKNIHVIAPVDYPSSIYLQSISELVITDSGGIQEESLILNRPILVTRTATERPETLRRINSEIVGASRELIFNKAKKILEMGSQAVEINRNSLLGNGKSAVQIAQRIHEIVPKPNIPIPIKNVSRECWVLLPAYNEQGNIGELLKEVAKLESIIKFRVVVVNDGSTDETAEEVKASRGSLNVLILENSENKGLGYTFKRGMEHIVLNAKEEDVVITMDADNSHLPAQIPSMISLLEKGHDLVIASRFRRKAETHGVPIYRKVLSRALGLLFQLFYPIDGVRDYSSGYRAYSVQAFRKVREAFGSNRLYYLDGFSCMLGLLVRFGQYRMKIVEVPLVLRYDQKIGPSKMNVFKTISASLKILISARRETLISKDSQDDSRVSKRTTKTGT